MKISKRFVDAIELLSVLSTTDYQTSVQLAAMVGVSHNVAEQLLMTLARANVTESRKKVGHRLKPVVLSLGDLYGILGRSINLSRVDTKLQHLVVKYFDETLVLNGGNFVHNVTAGVPVHRTEMVAQ